MNPFSKIRSGAGAAGTRIRGAASGAKGRVSSISRLGSGARDRAAGVRDGTADLWDRTGGSLIDNARSNPRVAIAWAVAGVLVLAWIGWTIYVWTSNGSTAGLGVLITWPAVIGALALISAPFVGATMLVRRHRLTTAGPAIPDTNVTSSPGQPAADSSADEEETSDAGEDDTSGSESEDEADDGSDGEADAASESDNEDEDDDGDLEEEEDSEENDDSGDAADSDDDAEEDENSDDGEKDKGPTRPPER